MSFINLLMEPLKLGIESGQQPLELMREHLFILIGNINVFLDLGNLDLGLILKPTIVVDYGFMSILQVDHAVLLMPLHTLRTQQCLIIFAVVFEDAVMAAALYSCGCGGGGFRGDRLGAAGARGRLVFVVG